MTSWKEVTLCRHINVQIIARLREILVIMKSILYGYQLAWSGSWKAWRMRRKATVTNGSFSQMSVVIGVNEKRKKSWLLNSPSGEVKCNAMQKKELSFSDSFPAIILYFQASPSSQISLGNCNFWMFPGKTQHCYKKSHSCHVPTLPCRSSEHRGGLAELLSCWLLIPNELFYHPKPCSHTFPMLSGCCSCNKQLSYRFKLPLFIAFRSGSPSSLTLLSRKVCRKGSSRKANRESKHRKTLCLYEKLELA